MASLCKTILLFFYLLSIYSFGYFLHLRLFFDYVQSVLFSEDYEEFDYIIVGSGSAGSIVAKRLAENRNDRILLLEAGGPRFGLLDIPPVGLMLQSSVYDWQYTTVPQKNACLALDDQVSKWPMGKLVGGTHNMNNLVYTRGHPLDYSRWFKNVPNFNYSNDILPYFEKLEKMIKISDLPFTSALSDAFIDAGAYLGFQKTDGTHSVPGFAKPRATLLNGARWTSSHALLSPLPANLVLKTSCQVEKVLFHADFEAHSVKYSKFGREYAVKAKKGVVLSAGAVGTPKILLLSGVGPAKHLREVGIRAKVDIEGVGGNLQDHLTSGLDLVLLNTTLGVDISEMMSFQAFSDYFSKGNGPWTTIGCENLAFFSTLHQQVPDLQFMVLPLGVTSDDGAFLAKLAGIGEKLLENYFRKIEKTSISILPITLHPKSRGTVRLNSNKPEDKPRIDPKYFTHPYDLETMLKGIDLIKKLLKTPPLTKIGAELNTLPLPGCENFTFDTEPYWRCYLRQLTITSYHPIGTCSMGTVVDYDFRVFRTNKLFIVDGSVLPDLPSGNSNGPIMMMAEKAVDEIRKFRWREEIAKSEVRDIFLVAEKMCK